MKIVLLASFIAFISFATLPLTGLTPAEDAPTNLERPPYPTTPKYPVVDLYHGTSVTDYYRWLEDANSNEVIAWTQAQNSYTHTWLDQSPIKEKIRQRITELYDFEQLGFVGKFGDFYFFWKHDGIQDHPVLYRTRSLKETPALAFNPNTLAPSDILSDVAINDDGTHITYAVSDGGRDHTRIRILHIDSGKEYTETLVSDQNVTRLSWNKSLQILYTRIDLGKKTATRYIHTVGTEQKDDQKIEPTTQGELTKTEDSKYFLLRTQLENDAYRVDYRAVATQEPFRTLIDTSKEPGDYELIGNVGAVFYGLVRRETPYGYVGAIDVSGAEPVRRIIIPETDAFIRSATILKNHLLVHFRNGSTSTLNRYTLEGVFLSSLPLPSVGCAQGLLLGDELFYEFSSPTHPTQYVRYNAVQGTLTDVFNGVKVKKKCILDAQQYETNQMFYQSKDGTRIPLLITHKKDIALDGTHPTLLCAYGGYNTVPDPSFDPGVALWLEHGGVYALANIRGGGEYGTQWHSDGRGQKRQNCFDDFCAAADWLIANNYTNPHKLAINGGSNGGLLVAVCMQQHPELFGAVISEIPVTDMLRFDLFTGGFFWIPEYGDIRNPDDFKTLYAYSPLYTVRAGVAYPPVLVTTGDNDERVLPLHAKKWVARLQDASTNDNPALLLCEANAGHGCRKSRAQNIDFLTNKFTFLFQALNETL